jgi:hypothetical protein
MAWLKLVDAREKALLITVDSLAVSYGLVLPVRATLVYNDEEFLESLEEEATDGTD